MTATRATSFMHLIAPSIALPPMSLGRVIAAPPPRRCRRRWRGCAMRYALFLVFAFHERRVLRLVW